MSGGVDSSVAAYLLKEAGYDVIGVTMQIWQDEDEEQMEENGGCCGLSAADDARRVANMLDIPHYVMNFKREFNDKVIEYFKEEYLQGRTPNPCIACNRYVKWESLLIRSLSIGADFIATGHYAKIKKLQNGRYAISNSVTSAKDQTYALYSLTQEQLAHTLMPVGAYSKEEIREIARKLYLPIANKPDSQEICFIPDHDYARFIEENSEKKIEAGNFVDSRGNILGRHRGITHYTIGQRKGLNLSFGKPMFVVEIRPHTNEVVLGEHKEVFKKTLLAGNINFMGVESFDPKELYLAKIRYSHKGAWCRIKMQGDNQFLCLFEEEQRAVTPGQAVVIYKDDYVAGGGTILC